MNITLDELQGIKHRLPKGSMRRIATDLQMDEEVVRSFFGAHRHRVSATDWHYESGALGGGVVRIANTAILDKAHEILKEAEMPSFS